MSIAGRGLSPLKFIDPPLSIEPFPLSRKGGDSLVGEGVGEGGPEDIGGKGDEMGTAEGGLLDLPDVPEGGCQYPGFAGVKLKEADNLGNERAAVSPRVLDPVEVGGHKVRPALRRGQGLKGGENRCRRNPETAAGEESHGCKTLPGDGNLDGQLAFDSFLEGSGLPDHGLPALAGNLDVEGGHGGEAGEQSR